MLKKVTVTGLFVLLALGSVGVVMVDAGKQVGICHFPGHNGDFVLGNQDFYADHSTCRDRGGDDVFVSVKSCQQAHQATPKFEGGLTCDDHHR